MTKHSVSKFLYPIIGIAMVLAVAVFGSTVSKPARAEALPALLDDDASQVEPMGACGSDLHCGSGGCTKSEWVCCFVCDEYYKDGRCKKPRQVCDTVCTQCGPPERP